MKHFKFISVVLLFVFSFLGSTGFYNHYSGLNTSHVQDVFLVCDTPPQVSSVFSTLSDVDMHFLIKNNIKKRVLSSKTSRGENIHSANLVSFKTLIDSVIYSIATLYENQRYIHLHRYQLF